MTKIIAAVALLCLATPALAEEAKPAAKKGKAPMAMTPADLKWTDVPRMKGLQSATVWGDPEKGAHGRFIKFAGGTDNPLHKHTNDLRSVVAAPSTWELTRPRPRTCPPAAPASRPAAGTT